MKVIDMWGESYEKHLGDDEDGQPMIWTRYIDHALVRFERDVRPEIQDKNVGWWDSKQEPVPGSQLDRELRKRLNSTQLDGLGISKVKYSDGSNRLPGTTLKVTYRGSNTGGANESPKDWVGEDDGLPF